MAVKTEVIRARVDWQLYDVVRSLAVARGVDHSTALREIVQDFGQRVGYLSIEDGDQRQEGMRREGS